MPALYLLENLTLIVSILITILFFLIVFLFWLERKILTGLLKNINRPTLIILLFLIIFFILLCGFKGLSFESFHQASHEWEAFGHAKNLALGDKTVFDHVLHGLAYPLIVGVGFKIFGFNPIIASVLNLTLGVFSILLVFLLAKVVFKKDNISLMAALIYALNPLIFSFTAFQMGEPTTTGFFLLLILLTGILSFKYHKSNFYLLTLLLITLVSQIKIEYFILIIPFFLCFFLFREYKYLSYKKTIAILFLFLFLSSPVFILNTRLKASYESGWAGATQTFHDEEEYRYSLPIIDQLDKILKPLTNNSFSFSYLVYDLPNFFDFWGMKYFIFSSFFILLGIFVSFKKCKKEALFILFSFLSLSWVYLAASVFYETRFAIPTFGALVIFSGLGINFISEKIQNYFKEQDIRKIINMILLITIITFPFSGFGRNRYLDSGTEVFKSDNYNEILDLVRGISPDDSMFINATWGGGTKTMILRFLGYQAKNLGDGEFLGLDYYRRSCSKEEYFKTLEFPINLKEKTYFIIDLEGYLSPIDKFVINNFPLELIKHINKNELYQFIKENR